MSFSDLTDHGKYNAARARSGRAPIARSTFSALEGVGVYAKDIEGFIAGSEAVYAAKLVKASEVADYWKSIAPVFGDKDPKRDSPAYGSAVGTYRDSIKVARHDGTVSVGTDSYNAAWLEYGSEHNPEHGYGARVLQYFGGGSVDSADKVSDTLYLG